MGIRLGVIVVMRKESCIAHDFLRIYAFSLLIFLLGISSYSQPMNGHSKWQPTIGITWRSTAMNFFDFGPIVPMDWNMKYTYEKNVQGFSLNPGIQYQLSRTIYLEYYPNLRFDVTHSVWNKKDDVFQFVNDEGDSLFINSNPSYPKTFLIDHNFNIIRKKEKLALGLGMTIVNAGKTLNYPVNHRIPSNRRIQDIEFSTLNGFVVFPVKKIYNVELKALFIPNNFPRNIYEQYMLYTIRVFYKFGEKGESRKTKR